MHGIISTLKIIKSTQLFSCRVKFNNVRYSSLKGDKTILGFAALIQSNYIAFDLIAQSEYNVTRSNQSANATCTHVSYIEYRWTFER